jgi:hypothetical protein
MARDCEYRRRYIKRNESCASLALVSTLSTSHMGRSLITDCQGKYGSEALFWDGPLLIQHFRRAASSRASS